MVNIFDRRVGGGNGTQPPLTSLCFRGFGAARVNSSMHLSLSCGSPSKKTLLLLGWQCQARQVLCLTIADSL